MTSKPEIRNYARLLRTQLPDKADRDNRIFQQILQLDAFQAANTVLCYVSLPEEIDTVQLMNYCFAHQKRVAVPYCNSDKTMDFYYIHSLQELHTGQYGIPEPDVLAAEKVTDFRSAVVIVPALCFQADGHRVGYGGGYYDKFLKNGTFISVGLCYNDLILKQIPTTDYDQAVNILVTEKQILFCDNGGKNG